MPDRSVSSRNGLLAALSSQEFALLEPHFEQVSLKRQAKLEHANRRIDQIYFIEAGVASVVASQGSTTVEIGIIGREGVTGLAVINGNDRSPYVTFMQVPGTARRISADRFREALERPALRRVLGRFAQAFMIQTSQTAVANARATIEERLARWLLMAHDRGDGDELALTHEFLSLMLGVGGPA